MTDELPPQWLMATVGAVARFVRGVTYSKEHASNAPAPGFTAVLRANNIGHGLNFDNLVFVPDRFVSDEQIVRDGDVVLAMSSGSKSIVGKAALAMSAPRCAFGAFCGVIRPSDAISVSFLGYYFQTKAYRNAVSEESKGININNLKADHILERPLPIPPRPEQKRIAAKIDELFSRIEEGERILERVQKLVERYRQSVLKAAVTGKLTRDWREKNKGKFESGEGLLARILKARREIWEKTELGKLEARGITPANGKWKVKYEEPGDIVTDYLGDLPNQWQRVRIDAVGEVQLGRQRSPAHHVGDFVRPYLRVANVHQERIDISDLMSMNFTPEEFATYSLRGGDILLNEGQSKELIGRPAMYRDEVPGACFTNTLIRFRATSSVLTEFAMLVFLHYMKSGDFQKIAKITTNIAHLGAGRFAEMSFPVPSVEEQREIVDRVDRQSSVYSQLIAEVAVRRRHVDSLRQSVLKTAFSGALVPQNPADESPSLLLERIVNERIDARSRNRRTPKNKTQEPA